MTPHSRESYIAQLEMHLQIARGRAAHAHPTDRSAAGEVTSLENALAEARAKMEVQNAEHKV
jgi:hypothetical protein